MAKKKKFGFFKKFGLMMLGVPPIPSKKGAKKMKASFQKKFGKKSSNENTLPMQRRKKSTELAAHMDGNYHLLSTPMPNAQHGVD